MKYTLINVDNWHRKEQFHFFKTFDEPFTGVVVDVNVSKAYSYCKQKGISFFQWYLHKCLEAASQTKAFCLRMVGDEVRKYESVDGSAVIMRSDGSFGFSHIPFDSDFHRFSRNVEAEKARIEVDRALFPPANTPNEIHISAMPWINFTGLSHARKYGTGDSCPKISFGKMTKKNGVLSMPVSIHVHHALADGKDMAEFIDRFQDVLDM